MSNDFDLTSSDETDRPQTDSEAGYSLYSANEITITVEGEEIEAAMERAREEAIEQLGTAICNHDPVEEFSLELDVGGVATDDE